MNKLMCHVVAGYPDPEACLRLILGMQASGAAAIEVQIPFSDPIADGETIMEANDVALASGTTTAASFELIEKARAQGLKSDIYIMSYLQKVLHFGFDNFCDDASTCGAKGLIIPDLPYDSPEYKELTVYTHNLGLELVPVLSPAMLESRLRVLLASNPPTVYVTSSRGITGNEYSPAAELGQLVGEVRKLSEAEIMIGFGISTPGDVREALALGDIAVVGSAVIKIIQESGVNSALKFVKTLAAG